MQVPIHQVIGVVAMRHGFVTAARPMFVCRIVAAADMASGRGTRVSGVDGNDVLIDVSFMQMMQVPIMQIIRVAFMLDGGMAASRTVLMRVRAVFIALLCHPYLLLKLR